MDLKDAVAADEDQIPDGNSMEKERYAFRVEYFGESGIAVNKILTHDEKNRAAVNASRMRGGQPYDAVEPLRAMLIEQMAWLHVSLEEKPKFMKDLGVVFDDDLIRQVWEVVLEHERIFRKSRKTAPSGA